MLFFIDYSLLETKLFKSLVKQFEAEDSKLSDDYENGFYDFVYIYGSDVDGQTVDYVEKLFSDYAQLCVETEYDKLNNTEQKELQEFYELNFMDTYYDAGNDEYIYSTEDLMCEITSRFKIWVYDNYSWDELCSLYDLPATPEDFDTECNYFDLFMQRLIAKQIEIDSIVYESKQVNPVLEDYLKVFDQLSVYKGWVLEGVYFNTRHGGRPILYPREASVSFSDMLEGYARFGNSIFLDVRDTEDIDSRLLDYEEKNPAYEYLKAAPNLYAYFQLLVYYLIGDCFALAWHSGYNDKTIVCSKRKLCEIAGDIIKDDTVFDEVISISPIPEIEQYDDNVHISILVYTQWTGIVRHNYTVAKCYPHSISLIDKEVIFEYDSGLRF